MKNKQVYLIGKMGGVPPEIYTKWRDDTSQQLFCKLDDDRINLTVICPNEFFGFEEKLHDNMMEIIQWELNEVKKSDVCIANLDFDNSTGSNIEIHTAWLHNIPVLAYQPLYRRQHPWIEQFVTRTFQDWDKLYEYISYYHLNV